MAREFKSVDPHREGLFTPSSENTTRRLIDFRAVKLGHSTVIIDAVNAYFHAEQDGGRDCQATRGVAAGAATEGRPS